MKGIFILTLAAALTAVAFISLSENGVEKAGEYEAFIAKFNRNYVSVEEYEFRQRIFEDNLNYIKNFNSQGKSWTLGINRFADKTQEEVKSLLNYHPTFSAGQASLGEITRPESPNDSEIDWRKMDLVRPMRNQLDCGSCWAFAANEGVETAWKVYNGLVKNETVDFPDLSEQLLVDCDKNSAGCQGGFMDNAYFHYITQCPVHEHDYPYTARDGTCKEEGLNCATDPLLGWYEVTSFDDEALREALNLGVVPVAIEAENKDFYLYEGGVISGPDCGFQLDHGVGLVGEHFEKNANGDEISVWDIKNSWGDEWGENGFARIERMSIMVPDETGKKYNVGVCGINMQNSIPTYFER